MIYKPKKTPKTNKKKHPPKKNHTNLWNPKLNVSLKFSKGVLNQTKVHPPKLPIELIPSRNELWRVPEWLNRVLKIFSESSVAFDLGPCEDRKEGETALLVL